MPAAQNPRHLSPDGKSSIQKYNPFGIKMYSKTVVMTKDYVSTGVLSYVEGDIIEVEMADQKSFKLGDAVKITIYSTGGIHVFNSHVVAKHRGSLIILNPPENQNKFAERREHPRVPVNVPGNIKAIIETQTKQRRELYEPLGMTLNNLSISGIGFTLSSSIDLHKYTELETELLFEPPLPVKVQIVRREKTRSGNYYGAQFIGLAPEMLTSLRGYVLKSQVEAYFRMKEEKQAAQQQSEQAADE